MALDVCGCGHQSAHREVQYIKAVLHVCIYVRAVLTVTVTVRFSVLCVAPQQSTPMPAPCPPYPNTGGSQLPAVDSW